MYMHAKTTHHSKLTNMHSSEGEGERKM